MTETRALNHDNDNRIDVHFHAVPQAFKEAAAKAGKGPTISSGFPEWSAANALDVMDRNGIATVITSISQPGVHFGNDTEAARLARLCNEEAASNMARWPTRFGGFATLPLPDMDGACKEIEYALDVLGLDGVCILASYGELMLGDAAFDPVWQMLNDRASVVFIHPNFHPSSRTLAWKLPAFLTEFPFDTTRAMTNLIFTGATKRYPKIRFILSHAGGTLPFLAWRLSMAPLIDARFESMTSEGILEEIGRFWFDTAQAAGPAVQAALRAVARPEKVLYGSDWPYCPETVLQETSQAIDASATYSPAEAEGIRRGNALALFPRLARAA